MESPIVSTARPGQPYPTLWSQGRPHPGSGDCLYRNTRPCTSSDRAQAPPRPGIAACPITSRWRRKKFEPLGPACDRDASQAVFSPARTSRSAGDRLLRERDGECESRGHCGLTLGFRRLSRSSSHPAQYLKKWILRGANSCSIFRETSIPAVGRWPRSAPVCAAAAILPAQCERTKCRPPTWLGNRLWHWRDARLSRRIVGLLGWTWRSRAGAWEPPLTQRRRYEDARGQS